MQSKVQNDDKRIQVSDPNRGEASEGKLELQGREVSLANTLADPNVSNADKWVLVAESTNILGNILKRQTDALNILNNEVMGLKSENTELKERISQRDVDELINQACTEIYKELKNPCETIAYGSSLAILGTLGLYMADAVTGLPFFHNYFWLAWDMDLIKTPDSTSKIIPEHNVCKYRNFIAEQMQKEKQNKPDISLKDAYQIANNKFFENFKQKLEEERQAAMARAEDDSHPYDYMPIDFT